jgi:hypothetical protein
MSETENIVDPIPNLPEAVPYEPKSDKGIRVATPDLIIFDDNALPVDNIISLIFENLGAQESINIIRNDLIDGANVDYSLVSNLKKIAGAYNSKNILNVPGTLEQYFKNFAIRLETHIPEKGSGLNGSIIYIDRNNQDPIQRNKLVIDVVGMKTNEQVEIQILNAGTYLNDIMESTEES